MFYQFGKLSVDGTQVVQLVNRGGKYQGKKLDINAPDSYYTDLGLIPIVGDTPPYDREKQKVSMSYEITPELITRVFTIEDLPIDEKIKKFEEAIQIYLDSKADERGYDDINSIGKYIGYENAFKIECEALGAWCASVWDYCYKELAKVQAGTRVEPTVEEFILELPVFVAP